MAQTVLVCDSAVVIVSAPDILHHDLLDLIEHIQGKNGLRLRFYVQTANDQFGCPRPQCFCPLDLTAKSFTVGSDMLIVSGTWYAEHGGRSGDAQVDLTRHGWDNLRIVQSA